MVIKAATRVIEWMIGHKFNYLQCALCARDVTWERDLKRLWRTKSGRVVQDVVG